MLNKKLIGLMQHGTMVINTASGNCVDTADIIEGMKNGHIGHYGCDVYENEAGIFTAFQTGNGFKDEKLEYLLSNPNVLLTPHMAFATKETISAMAVQTFSIIENWKVKQKSNNGFSITESEKQIPSYIDDEES